MYKELNDDNSFYSISNVFFHGGVTYHKAEIDKKIYGCDYNHYDDDRFLRYDTIEKAYEVLNDATELFEALEKQQNNSIK